MSKCDCSLFYAEYLHIFLVFKLEFPCRMLTRILRTPVHTRIVISFQNDMSPPSRRKLTRVQRNIFPSPAKKSVIHQPHRHPPDHRGRRHPYAVPPPPLLSPLDAASSVSSSSPPTSASLSDAPTSSLTTRRHSNIFKPPPPPPRLAPVLPSSNHGAKSSNSLSLHAQPLALTDMLGARRVVPPPPPLPPKKSTAATIGVVLSLNNPVLAETQNGTNAYVARKPVTRSASDGTTYGPLFMPSARSLSCSRDSARCTRPKVSDKIASSVVASPPLDADSRRRKSVAAPPPPPRSSGADNVCSLSSVGGDRVRRSSRLKVAYDLTDEHKVTSVTSASTSSSASHPLAETASSASVASTSSTKLTSSFAPVASSPSVSSGACSMQAASSRGVQNHIVAAAAPSENVSRVSLRPMITKALSDASQEPKLANSVASTHSEGASNVSNSIAVPGISAPQLHTLSPEKSLSVLNHVPARKPSQLPVPHREYITRSRSHAASSLQTSAASSCDTSSKSSMALGALGDSQIFSEFRKEAEGSIAQESASCISSASGVDCANSPDTPCSSQPTRREYNTRARAVGKFRKPKIAMGSPRKSARLSGLSTSFASMAGSNPSVALAQGKCSRVSPRRSKKLRKAAFTSSVSRKSRDSSETSVEDDRSLSAGQPSHSRPSKSDASSALPPSESESSEENVTRPLPAAEKLPTGGYNLRARTSGSFDSNTRSKASSESVEIGGGKNASTTSHTGAKHNRPKSPARGGGNKESEPKSPARGSKKPTDEPKSLSAPLASECAPAKSPSMSDSESVENGDNSEGLVSSKSTKRRYGLRSQQRVKSSCTSPRKSGNISHSTAAKPKISSQKSPNSRTHIARSRTATTKLNQQFSSPPAKLLRRRLVKSPRRSPAPMSAELTKSPTKLKSLMPSPSLSSECGSLSESSQSTGASVTNSLLPMMKPKTQTNSTCPQSRTSSSHDKTLHRPSMFANTEESDDDEALSESSAATSVVSDLSDITHCGGRPVRPSPRDQLMKRKRREMEVSTRTCFEVSPAWPVLDARTQSQSHRQSKSARLATSNSRFFPISVEVGSSSLSRHSMRCAVTSATPALTRSRAFVTADKARSQPVRHSTSKRARLAKQSRFPHERELLFEGLKPSRKRGAVARSQRHSKKQRAIQKDNLSSSGTTQEATLHPAHTRSHAASIRTPSTNSTLASRLRSSSSSSSTNIASTQPSASHTRTHRAVSKSTSRASSPSPTPHERRGRSRSVTMSSCDSTIQCSSTSRSCSPAALAVIPALPPPDIQPQVVPSPEIQAQVVSSPEVQTQAVPESKASKVPPAPIANRLRSRLSSAAAKTGSILNASDHRVSVPFAASIDEAVSAPTTSSDRAPSASSSSSSSSSMAHSSRSTSSASRGRTRRGRLSASAAAVRSTNGGVGDADCSPRVRGDSLEKLPSPSLLRRRVVPPRDSRSLPHNGVHAQVFF